MVEELRMVEGLQVVEESWMVNDCERVKSHEMK